MLFRKKCFSSRGSQPEAFPLAIYVDVDDIDVLSFVSIHQVCIDLNGFHAA
jgi:hypothetical protein